MTGDPAAIVIEPGLGGLIYERTNDGTEIHWGETPPWGPPQRFTYRWHIEYLGLVKLKHKAHRTASEPTEQRRR